MYKAPNWSFSARKSLGLHYRDLQDVEIYVEDIGSEALYTKLFTRAARDQVRIRKIIPLNGRENVVEACKQYKEDFPALFVIDGDLSLVCGEPEPPHSRLFQHRMYCMENYLFCKKASAELLQNKSGKLLEKDAYSILDWENFTEKLQALLVELFKHYAVSWKLKPELPTVSRSYHKLCIKVSKAKGHELCETKVNDAIDEIKENVVASCGEHLYNEVYETVSSVIDTMEPSLNAVSGKDYLLKALRDYLHSKGASFPLDEGFKFQLARYCDVEPLVDLGEAIIQTASGEVYRSVS